MSNDATPLITRDDGFGAARILNTLGPLIGLAFAYALFAALRFKTFVSWDNTEIMLLQTAVVGTAALGMTLIIIAGGIDLAAGSTIALVTVVIAKLLEAGASPLVAAGGGILTGAICGMVSGMLITGLRLLPFIVTLGMMGVLRGLAKGIADEQPIYPDTSWIYPDDHWVRTLMLKLPPGKQWMLVPPGVWIMLLLAAVVAIMLRYTRFGRHAFAIGSNEQTARLCGVNVARNKVLIYTIGSMLAGVAGLFQFSYLTGGDPTSAVGLELNIIAAVVIGGASLSGGQGSIAGALIGALIMTVVSNGCTKMGYANWVQEIVTGGIIVAAVMLDKLRHRAT